MGAEVDTGAMVSGLITIRRVKQQRTDISARPTELGSLVWSWPLPTKQMRQTAQTRDLGTGQSRPCILACDLRSGGRDQITVPSGMMAFLGMTTIPSRMT
jgi:hypothetical protein